MTILFCADLPSDERLRWRAALADALPEADWVDAAEARSAQAAARIDVAVVANPPAGALAGLPALGFVQSLWAGVDRLLADPSLPPALPVARMVDPAMTAAMGETALWAVLGLHRGFARYAAQQRAGVWQMHPQRRADEVTVAVLGLGEMGRATATRLRAQGYRVLGWRRGEPDGRRLPGVEIVAGEAALHDLLAVADIVVNLLPLTPQTRGLFDAARLGRLRPGAALVNLGRGAHVVEDDLRAALDSGRLSHAVLDVFQTEPLPAGHWLWTHPSVTLLPHVAAQTDERTASRVVADNVRGWWAGRLPPHLADRSRGY